MARKYTRDNRGRFASAGGGGATARGGRLRTAAGNKRATQTMRAQGAGGAGVIRGRTARTVAGQKVMEKLPKAAPKAVVTAKGAGIGGGKKVVSVGALRTNKELGRRGMVGMSANRKAVRRSDVTERRMEKLARVTERGKPSEMMARRRNSTIPTYSPDGKFNQSAANLNQKKAARTKALAERNAYAGQGRAAAASSFNRKPKSPKPAAPAKAKAAPKARVNASDFQRRAVATEKRARVAEKALSQLDRFNPANKKARNRAYALRNAADSYSSIVRRSKNNPDFTAAQIFNQRGKSSTAPKLTPSQKAARTRMANKAAKNEANRKRMEQARKYG